MFNKYYQQELQNLRELGAEFAKSHPALAPLLSGPSSDPDVERLLEGVAFLTGLLRHKLDDELPELIHGMMDIIFPHYLRPVPATSIVAFAPKPNLRESVTVAAGTSLASLPIEGTECIFRTCYELEVHPLRLAQAELLREPGRPDRIRLVLELTGQNLSQWKPKRLSLFLSDNFTQATDLLLLLTRYVRKITVRELPDGNPAVLPEGSLAPIGFDLRSNLLPYPTHSFQGYRLLQEYFTLPQKFLFLELRGWEQWQDRGRGTACEVIFELLPAPVPLPKIRPENFTLFATPVINLFTQETDPIILDHRLERIRVRPTAKAPGHLQVYSVEKVVGFEQGSVARKEYVPLGRFSLHELGNPVYQVTHSVSPVDDLPDVYLAFTYPPGGPAPVTETLSLTLKCTNGTLPERLKLGDICRQTADSPELLTFRNITPATFPEQPQLDKSTLWRFLSHLSLNYLPIADAGNLRELLSLYITPGRDRAKTAANRKRVEGIAKFNVKPMNLLVGGLPMRGQKLELSARQDNFAGVGDLYVFGTVLDAFFGVYASMNTFTRFQLVDLVSGEKFVWPSRIGDRPLA